MTIESYFVFGVFVATIFALIKFQQKPSLIFGIAFLVLFSSQMVSTEQVIKSFSNQGVLTLILLMICSFSLEKTRLLRLIAMKVISKSYRYTWLKLFGSTVLSSAFLNNTAVVSTLLAPIRNNPYHEASKLLIPLSYAAILGGTLTLVGTSTNLIVNSLVIDANLPALNFFDFTIVGSFLVVTCGIALFFLSKYLPNRSSAQSELDSYFIEAKVSAESTLIGKSVEDNGLRHLESLFLVEIMRGRQLLTAINPKEVLQAGDRLIFCGDILKVSQLNHFDGLTIFAEKNGLPLDNLREVVVREESVLIGRTIKRVGFRSLFDAAVVAIKRDGEKVSGKLGNVIIKSGDFLVLAVGEDYQARRNVFKNFISLSEVAPDSSLSGVKEAIAIGGFFTAILLAALNILPLFNAVMILLGILLLTGCLTSSEILRRLPVNLWLIISSAITISYALQNNGLNEQLSYLLNYSSGGYDPLIALIMIYLLTWLLTELITNNAAAALMFPLAYNISISLDSQPIAFIMVVAFGASASFISPYGYQTNLMVFNAGQYRFKDFIKIGLPIGLIYSVVALTGIVYVYGV
ncbi:SLC13 family permease [Colwelliaceae bacterium MEBiC 14330]